MFLIVFLIVIVLLTAYSPELGIFVLLGTPLLLILLAAVAGLVQYYLLPRRTRTHAEVASILREFLEDPSTVSCNLDGSFWDEFLIHRIKDPRLEEIRRRCARLSAEFPSKPSDEWDRMCSKEGEQLVRLFIAELEDGGVARRLE